ncbi:hypothetical protein BGZ58_008159 [Dissophora ornata]|nr:hypothetical protein BGZ58_008159 [Dissophora ornata]
MAHNSSGDNHQDRGHSQDLGQGFREKGDHEREQGEEEEYIAFDEDSGGSDLDPESDIEIDLSTSNPRSTSQSQQQQQQQRRKKVPKHFRKSNSKVYDNISVYAPPDSALIFRCSQRRATWYLSRNLARSLSPTSIHLNFSPAGQGHAHDANSYHLEERENKCVVCGERTEEAGATMLHVVPEQYRKWFPIRLKSHASHDIVVACPACNAEWDREAAVVRKRIVDLYKIPLEGVGWIKDYEAGAAKRSAGAVIADWNRRWQDHRYQQSSTCTGDSAAKDDELVKEKVENQGLDIGASGQKPASKKVKVRKQNVIPAERMQELEQSVYEWWCKAHPAAVDTTEGSSHLKREHSGDISSEPYDSADDRKKKLKSGDNNEMDASILTTDTTNSATPSAVQASGEQRSTKPKDAGSVEVPMPPPGHSTLINRKMLEDALEAQASYKAPDYKEHGQLVIARVMASSPEYHEDAGESQETIRVWKEATPLPNAPEGWRNVAELIRTWRSEFLNRIKPRNLSTEWRVENPV